MKKEFQENLELLSVALLSQAWLIISTSGLSPTSGVAGASLAADIASMQWQVRVRRRG